MSISRLAGVAINVSIIVVLVYITARNDSYQFKHTLFVVAMTYVLLFFSSSNPRFGQSMLHNSIFVVFIGVFLNLMAWALYPTVHANRLTHNIQLAVCTVMSYQLAFYLVKLFSRRLSGNADVLNTRQFTLIIIGVSALSLLIMFLLLSWTNKSA